jgi:hypothetical protein
MKEDSQIFVKDDPQYFLLFGRPIQEGRAGGMHGALVRYEGCTKYVNVKSWRKKKDLVKTDVNSRTLKGRYVKV